MVNIYDNKFDVTIVGSGPTGSILSYELAKRGIKVLILEKEKLPRYKVCAGGITVRASSLIPFDFSEVIENVIYGTRLSYDLRPQKVRMYDKPLTYMVSRDKFDYYLASKAKEAGAILKEEVFVRSIEPQSGQVLVTTDSGTFTTPLLVGADGANSMVVKSLGLKNGFEYGLCLNCQIKVSRDKLQEWDQLMGFDMGIPGGYAWVFPKKDYLSVGAGSSFRVIKQLRPYIKRLIQSFQLGEPDGQSLKGHLMPIRRANTPLSYQRVLLVGDAAGMVDPFSGEGIYYGLKSSYLALKAILNFTEGKTGDLKGYDADVNSEIMPELKIARVIQKLNCITPRIYSHYLNENDRCWRAFCRMLRGEKTYTQIKNFLAPPFRAIFDIL
jgi:geranylgeranyl reductase family protein